MMEVRWRTELAVSWQSPFELSSRFGPRPAASLSQKQPILVQTTPPVASTDLGSPRLFPTSEFPFVARIRAVRGVSSMPQLTLLMRQERSSKLRELKLCLQSGCYAAGSVKNKKESATAFEGGEKTDQMWNKKSPLNRVLKWFSSILRWKWIFKT